MTAHAQQLARKTFQTACGDGPSEQPKSLQQFISQTLDTSVKLSSLDTESLAQALFTEFPFMGALIGAGIAPDSFSSARWEVAVRSVLNGLRSWSSSNTNALIELRALLVTAQVLDAHSEGLECVAAQLAGDEVTAGVLGLIESADIGPYRGTDHRFPDVRRDLKTITQQGNYERLNHLLPYLMPEPCPGLWGAIILLWKLDPAKLAKAVTDKDNVLFSIFVCLVLKDSAAQFALQVPLVSFKFVSINNLPGVPTIDRTTNDWGNLLRQLFLQVAKTSDWAGWMLALFKYPRSDSRAEEALTEALVSLEETHWTAFVQGLSLGYSRAAAEPVAHIMARFASRAGATKAKVMWSIAFKRWDEWNYAHGEKQAYMFAPVSCALDYPVAMYYSQLTGPELDAKDAELTQAVEEIEQQWFESASDLITERNRRLSRLRLVRQARAVAGGGANLLPPPVRPDADPYAQVRYHYFEVPYG